MQLSELANISSSNFSPYILEWILGSINGSFPGLLREWIQEKHVGMDPWLKRSRGEAADIIKLLLNPPFGPCRSYCCGFPWWCDTEFTKVFSLYNWKWHCLDKQSIDDPYLCSTSQTGLACGFVSSHKLSEAGPAQPCNRLKFKKHHTETLEM